MGFEAVRATPLDRDAVVATVVAAFAADPAFRFFFRDEEAFPAHATAFARYLFDKRVAQGSVWIAEGGAVAALWEPPSQAAEPGEPPVLDVPADAAQRIERYDRAVHRLLPPAPHWYLGILATHPRWAGRRLGRRLMAAGVASAHAEGLPAVLETVNPSNVELYRREGWEVIGRTDAADVPSAWVLVNQPAAPAVSPPSGLRPAHNEERHA